MTLDQRPHARVSSADLATWIERQGPDLRWTYDGEWRPEAVIFLPVRGAEFAAELRRLSGELLVEDTRQGATTSGERIGADDLDRFTRRNGGCYPPTADDRVLTLAWASRPDLEWELNEDRSSTELFRQDDEALARRRAAHGQPRCGAIQVNPEARRAPAARGRGAGPPLPADNRRPL
ncbi:MAG: hypothetical protein ACRC33_20840 [Gemmataceae bacterium]